MTVQSPPSPPVERLGIAFMGAPAVPDMVRIAQRAEDLGYESVWVAETRMTRDAVVPMAAIAAATSRVRVGSAVLNPFTRTAGVLALSFVTLDELAPGRIVMGLGAGSPKILAMQGIPFDKPLTRLTEYTQVLPRLMRGEEVSFEGRTLRLDCARIDDLAHGPDSRAAGSRVPLYLGVTGGKGLALAGERADGILTNGFMSTSYIERAIESIGGAAARVGRDLTDFEITALLVVSVDGDSAVAKHAARRMIAMYLSLFPNVARETALPAAHIERTRNLFFTAGIDAAAETIDDDTVDTYTVAGTPAECRERILQYRKAGVTVPVVSPINEDMMHGVEALAPGWL